MQVKQNTDWFDTFGAAWIPPLRDGFTIPFSPDSWIQFG